MLVRVAREDAWPAWGTYEYGHTINHDRPGLDVVSANVTCICDAYFCRS